jgi:hypothetical protein
MKINPFLTIIALLFAAIVSYALYSYCHAEALRWLITLFGGVSIFLAWAGTIAVSLTEKKRNVNFKVMNGLFATAITAMQLIFTFSAVSTPTYLLCSGVLLLVWLTLAYAMAK